MARQKVSNEQVQRQEMEVIPGKEEITETTEGNEKIEENHPDDASSSGSDHTSTSSEEEQVEMDDVLAAMDHTSAFAHGNAAEKEGNNDRAIQCFQAAIHKYVAQGYPQTSPEIADYWLAYGSILLKVEEATAALFADGPDDEGEDNLKTIWESLDVARVCYSKKISNLVEENRLERSVCDLSWRRLIPCISVMQDMNEQEGPEMDESQIDPRDYDISVNVWSERKHDDEVLKTLKNAIFTRLRLGDFCQVQMRYEDSLAEFGEALQMCFEYGAPYCDGLQVAVGLAHSLVGLGNPKGVPAFRLACKLIDAELPSATAERKALLEEFKTDLIRQMEDFEQEESKLGNESEQMAEEQAALGEVEKTAPVDLGRVGGTRKQTRE